MATTQKMIDYAIAIAESLGLSIPDFTDYKATSMFIAAYCDEYKRKRRSRLSAELSTLNIDALKDKHGKELSDNFKQRLNDLVNVRGIYLFWQDDKIVYVGKSLDLNSRILTSLEERLKYNAEINKLSIIECLTEADTHILEIVLITELKPQLNRDCMCSDYSKHFSSGVVMNELPCIDIFKN